MEEADRGPGGLVPAVAVRPRAAAARDNHGMSPDPPRPVPPDYDQDHERFRLARAVLREQAPSRDDSPELAHALPDTALTFDAESAPGLLAELFVDVEVERWDAPLVTLPTHDAVRDYLIGKGVEAKRAQEAGQAADVPLSVTKRGALAFARRGD
jgi:hypothetical protein